MIIACCFAISQCHDDDDDDDHDHDEHGDDDDHCLSSYHLESLLQGFHFLRPSCLHQLCRTLHPKITNAII